MTRSALHPKYARHVANHIIEKVWRMEPLGFVQMQSGVFMEGDAGVVVIDAADVSETAATALRMSGHLWEFAVLMYRDDDPIVYGPRHLYDEQEWANILGGAIAATAGIQCVLTTFEVAPIRDAQEAANVGAASAIVAMSLQTSAEPSADLLAELLYQLDCEAA